MEEYMRDFNPGKVSEDVINWIRNWFDNNGKDCNAVLGISGGKDSTVAAALCVRALGKNRVIGVMMPNEVQPDIDDSKKVCEFLGIRNYTINIGGAFKAINAELEAKGITPTSQAVQNLPPRLRMSALYAVSQSNNGRVANTCNLSEDYIGYATKYGDGAGDFAPLQDLTVAEIIAIGDYLELPGELVHKAPSDGLCGKTDEDNIGFTYAVLDKYIRTGVCEDKDILDKIEKKHRQNEFKLKAIDKFVLE